MKGVCLLCRQWILFHIIISGSEPSVCVFLVATNSKVVQLLSLSAFQPSCPIVLIIQKFKAAVC